MTTPNAEKMTGRTCGNCGNGPRKDYIEQAEWLDEHSEPHPCQYCAMTENPCNWTPKQPSPVINTCLDCGATTCPHCGKIRYGIYKTPACWIAKQPAPVKCPVCKDTKQVWDMQNEQYVTCLVCSPKQPAPVDAPSRSDKCTICAHLEDGFCNAGIDCVGGSAFTPKPAPSDGQDANSHPVLFADDFLSTAMQKLDFLMERGSRCVAIILQNRYGYQQKIDRWGKVVIVEEKPMAQDVTGVLEDDALALRISLSCHYDNNDPLLNAINAYRDAVRERVKHD